jgi:hypothetical protein
MKQIFSFALLSLIAMCACAARAQTGIVGPARLDCKTVSLTENFQHLTLVRASNGLIAVRVTNVNEGREDNPTNFRILTYLPDGAGDMVLTAQEIGKPASNARLLVLSREKVSDFKFAVLEYIQKENGALVTKSAPIRARCEQ